MSKDQTFLNPVEITSIANSLKAKSEQIYNEYKTSELIFEYLNKLSTLFYDLALRYEK